MVGRAYWAVNMETLAQLGSSSGYLSVLVLALYINSDAAGTLYSQSPALWLLKSRPSSVQHVLRGAAAGR